LQSLNIRVETTTKSKIVAAAKSGENYSIINDITLEKARCYRSRMDRKQQGWIYGNYVEILEK